MGIGPDEIFEIAPHFRLQSEKVPQRHVLLYPEGLVELSASAAEILTRCGSGKTVRDIIADLEEDYEGDDLAGDVVEFLEEAAEHGWITVQRSE